MCEIIFWGLDWQLQKATLTICPFKNLSARHGKQPLDLSINVVCLVLYFDIVVELDVLERFVNGLEQKQIVDLVHFEAFLIGLLGLILLQDFLCHVLHILVLMLLVHLYGQYRRSILDADCGFILQLILSLTAAAKLLNLV